MSNVSISKKVYDDLIASAQELLVTAQGGPQNDQHEYMRWAMTDRNSVIDRANAAIQAAKAGAEETEPPSPSNTGVARSLAGMKPTFR